MRKSYRGLIITGSIIAGLALVLLAGWLVLTRMSFPRTSGTVRLDGISAPVTIIRDRNGVPHIYARTTKDLFFAEGYVHAQDRYWQMEFCRRIGEGRLSELFGESQLQTDIFLRTLGIARVASLEYRQTDPETKGQLDAYAAGVNAYIMHRSPARLGLEFAILNLTGVKTKIEPWSPVNTLEWAKMMALSEEGNWDDDVFMSRIVQSIGTRIFSSFYTPYRKEMPFAVSDAELGREAKTTARPFRFFGGDSDTGSNGWAISGSRTSSGKPILANDMHLDQQLPGTWYEVGLHGVAEDGTVGRTDACPYDLFGYSLPGAPGVVVGHNDRIAWGFMDLHGDVQDLYIEKINPEDPDQYMVDGEWRDMDIVYEEIKVKKAKEPYRLRVRLTRHGPIISDHGGQTDLAAFRQDPAEAFPESTELSAVSLQWYPLQPSSTLKAVLSLNRAQNYQEFRAAMSGWTAPSLNCVYADVDGNIAYQCIGRIPMREKGFGEALIPGWVSSFEWKGFIPFTELPSSLNPAKGYVVSANNPPAGGAYKHFIGSEMDYGYRARRIAEMIESAKNPITVDDVKAMHADNLNYFALELCAALKGLDLSPTALEKRITEDRNRDFTDKQKSEFAKKQSEEIKRMTEARDELLAWDGRMDGDSRPAAMYAYFWSQLVAEIFHDQYPEKDWPMKASAHAENAVHYLLADPGNGFWDDITTPEEREDRNVMLVRAFRRGYQALVEKWGDNRKKWRWDKLHTITFVHPTLGKSGIGPIEKLFNRGPYPVSGGATQVNAEAWDRKKPFEVLHIPSMREIVPMDNLSDALTILPAGQSGHPFNRHYADMVDRWRKVEYHPMLWDRKEIEKQSEGKLVLMPK